MSDAATPPDRSRSEPRGGLPGRLFNRAVGAVVPSIVDNVDVDEVVQQIDMNELLERVDVNRLLERIDVNQLLDRIDINQLMSRVDMDALLAGVDVNALVQRVDVNQIVRRAELDVLIARSTAGVATQVLDGARANAIVVDQAVHSIPARLLRPKESWVPARPGAPADQPDVRGVGIRARAVALQGHFAGSVSRFVAFLIDQFLVGFLFGIGVVLASSAVQVVMNREIGLADGRWQFALAYALWWYAYMAVQLAATGRTVGKGLLGLLVVNADGTPLSSRRALLRPLVFPLSFLVFGAGFLIGVVRRDRRQLHDLLAGTAVVYHWDAGAAQLRERAEA